MKKVLLLFSIFILGCKQSQLNNNFNEINCCSNCVVYIQPYDNFTIKEANKIIPELEKQFNYWFYGKWKFKILDPISLPKSSYLINYDKYEAVKILDYQKNTINNGIIIGLTHKDICTNAHGVKHYGIIGISYCPGNVCLVSDKRIRNKSQIWKPILHEFMHAYYGDRHCLNDDPKCFMKDAKGHANFGIQNRLCNLCDKHR